jgi:EAL and modified HD-GYP domain-containing signal transduction protein
MNHPTNNKEIIRVCVARQTIFDAKSKVFAYEILYRRSAQEDTSSTSMDASEITREVIKNVILGIGLGPLLAGRKGFLNVPYEFLSDELLTALPPDQISLEILETAQPTEAALLACQGLRASGFSLILDDYIGQEHLRPFLDVVDLVKIDVRQVVVSDLKLFVGELHDRGLTVLAEKVETQGEFESYREIGFDYFQGFFLERPVLVQGARLSDNQLEQFKLFRLLASPVLNWVELEKTVSRDPVLVYQLIRYASSARYGLRTKVESLHRCLITLGELEIRRLLLLLSVREVSSKPNQLMQDAVTRARTMELVCVATNRTDKQREAAFLTGLFSNIEAAIGVPFEVIALQLGLSPEIEQAITGATDSSFLGRLLLFTKSYERGDWTASEKLEGDLGVSLSLMAKIYLEALTWSLP